ncbi:anhydro-N-acetylmuramic acid kinase [Endozoicomonas sp. OPT23]|uniref:anhydro-N-acetylmuramic acid kinase n=1 Tax=Endozoicomonas sp. OPT23 TaxID=2072845 RepID=UPI00129B4DE8|nr:anhydro-N-acetylmuramic acid kinase [Endozoicomonas sp. OPT23]MRI33437.1 anhydro-N-acetylmuramic acid kinase [Endozoicomonas sp. OPT23]
MPELFIGLMSGTSLDAIDATLVAIENDQCQSIASLSHPLPAELKQQLQTLTLPGDNEIERMAEAEPLFASESATAVHNLLEKSGYKPDQIKAIGSHGQTIRHRPEKGYTLQIGDPSLIAELTGITVVGDFRRRDVAAGGQGAPLVPAFHKAVFHQGDEDRVIVNIGGMANLTLLSADSSIPVTGFDTGPGNILMDYWTQQHLGQPFDNNGDWAAKTSADEALLKQFLTESYFQQATPKSTGRELFNPDWLSGQLNNFSHLSANTVAATLCKLTAVSIATHIKQYSPDSKAVYICGGGARNANLMELLRQELSHCKVQSTSFLGIDPDWVEAIAFAWLASRTLGRLTSNLPEVTGAKGLRMLGAIYPA